MELIGYLDSPFVRRVAITMRFLSIKYSHRELSIFRDFDQFSRINPTVKVPTLVLDDGQILIDSNLIISYLESQLAGYSLMPSDANEHVTALHHIGIAMVAMEKAAQLVYETTQRPESHQHGPWIDRLESQLKGAADLMESAVADSSASGHTWLLGEQMNQADITTAVAWRFLVHTECVKLQAVDFPALVRFSARAEDLPEFLVCPLT